jgi:hypothetical protein
MHGKCFERFIGLRRIRSGIEMLKLRGPAGAGLYFCFTSVGFSNGDNTYTVTEMLSQRQRPL